jgi:hypothetical protein
MMKKTIFFMGLALLLTAGGIGFAEQQKSSAKEEGKQQVQKQGAKGVKQMSMTRPLVGREVRSSRGDDIGQIQDVVVNEEGSVRVVVGTGGFLDLGGKRVLVELGELRLKPRADYAVYKGTEQDLQEMAAYAPPGRRTEPVRAGLLRGGTCPVTREPGPEKILGFLVEVGYLMLPNNGYNMEPF